MSSTGQLSTKSKNKDLPISALQIPSASPVLDPATPVQQVAVELFDELELPISSTVWGVTPAWYINGTDEVNPNIPKLQPPTLVPISGDSAVHKVFGTVEFLKLVLESCAYRDLLYRLVRINKTWKAIIDESKYIQQHLFFLPWQENDYPWRWGQFNPFMFLLAYQRGEDSAPGCCYHFGMGDEEEVASEDEGWIFEEHNREIWMEFNWDKIKQDERFTREGAS